MWTSDGVLFAVQHTIRGIAKTWLDAQQVYRSFKSVVELWFPSVVKYSDAHKELIRPKRRKSETLIEYFYAMLSIGRRTSIDEPLINSNIINGLYSQGLTKALLANGNTTATMLTARWKQLSVMCAIILGTLRKMPRATAKRTVS